MSKGNLFVLSGPSGVGKGTILNRVLQSNDNLMLAISATTREIREGEQEGINYYYITYDRFQQMIDRDELLEYAKVYNNYYGTPKRTTMDLIERGNNVILELDTLGAMNIKKMFKDAVTIFLMPPDKETLMNRLAGRGTENEEVIQMRFREASKEIERAKSYDYIVMNDNADDCANQVIGIIEDIMNKRRV